jgi:RNA polymerase sigma-70 factor, ECF subfamily
LEFFGAMPEFARGEDLTTTLRSAGNGDREAVDALLPLVYDELRRLAESHLQRERDDHTLQATALVHEAYMKMIDQSRVQWRDRAHFFALASQAIRRILVDHARGRGRKKRVGNRQRLSLNEVPALEPADVAGLQADLVDLDDALTRLAQEHPEKARVVEMRFFGGLTTEECADVLGVTTRTVERHWTYARAWLYREIGEHDRH